MRRLLSVFLLPLAAAVLPVAAAGHARAQVAPDHVVVLTRTQTASTLLDVDPSTGAWRTLPRFPFDVFPARAVAVDPVDGDVVVALENLLDRGTALYRIRFAGGQVIRFRSQGTVHGSITDMGFGLDGDLFATVEGPAGAPGGIVRFVRNTGTASNVNSLTGPTAMEVFAQSGFAVIAQSGAVGAVLSGVDLGTGQQVVGPVAIPQLAGRIVTGVHDLPTGAIRHVLTDDLGRLHLLEFLAQLTTIPLNPPLPPGAANAARGLGIDLAVLGGASHPFLKSVVVFGQSAGTWTAIAGPFPGDPVDFAFAASGGPRLAPFGASCAGGGSMTATGLPRVGNAQFRLGVRAAAPNAQALLLVGLDDQQLGPVLLPFALPGGCLLHVSTEVPLAASTDASGTASQPVPIPDVPALIDARVFAQWLVLAGGTLGSSDAVAVWIGP